MSNRLCLHGSFIVLPLLVLVLSGCGNTYPPHYVYADEDSWEGPVDADGDGVFSDEDSDDDDPYVCSDVDEDGCDDCSSGIFDEENDGFDDDEDGLCDRGDFDDEASAGDDEASAGDDDDSAGDDDDSAGDDDESAGDDDDSAGDESADGDEWSTGPVDADGDGVSSDDDIDDSDPYACTDLDGDSCDDCSSGVYSLMNDGFDFDGDGQCDAGDFDDDNDGSVDSDDTNDNNTNVCGDLDGDSCDDCSSGSFNPDNDGFDFDGDGFCDAGDFDDDNDGAVDWSDTDDNNASVCGDTDADSCDDCSSGVYNPSNDGPDFDSDGLCDAVDPPVVLLNSSVLGYTGAGGATWVHTGHLYSNGVIHVTTNWVLGALTPSSGTTGALSIPNGGCSTGTFGWTMNSNGSQGSTAVSYCRSGNSVSISHQAASAGNSPNPPQAHGTLHL